MSPSQRVGMYGEQLAVQYLKRLGYEITSTNWRHSKAEIDIIARKGQLLIFVEVKTRTSDQFGEPAEFVTPNKEKMMSAAASMYMELVNHDWEIRFDVISVLLPLANRPIITHFKDAFFPGL